MSEQTVNENQDELVVMKKSSWVNHLNTIRSSLEIQDTMTVEEATEAIDLPKWVPNPNGY